MPRTKLAALAIAGVLAVTACTAGTDTSKGKDGVLDPGDIQLVAALEPFSACDEFLAWVKDEALERVGPYGLPGIGGRRFGGVEDLRSTAGGLTRTEAGATVDQVAKSSVADDLGGGGAQPGYSSTNTVEAGVDEADIVKTDGTRIVTISQNKLRVLDPNNGAPKELGALQLDQFWGSTLFLAGDKALVVGQIGMAWRDGRLAVIDPNIGGLPDDIYIAGTRLTEVDLSNPASPKVVRTLTAEGNLVNSRMVGDTARIVVQSTPSKFEFLFPQGPQSEDRALRNNREAIAESTVDQWLPSFVLDDGGTNINGRLVPCDGVHHPSTFSGFSITSVLTVDLGGKLTPGDGVAVLADGQQVYASADNLYVAVNRFEEEAQEPATGEKAAASSRIAPVPFPTGNYETAIHKFSIKGEAPATYLASGKVRGHLMNDFSLSEHNGNLRLATTDGPPWGGPVPIDIVESDGSASSNDEQQPEEKVAESFVTVLADKGGELTQLGQVGGLGKGERIYGVRFLGDVGYVVTFRQVDPLYTLDLSNPAQPTVKGELKILGYSAYLHPLPDGKLLGVGADATEEGRRTGVQVSVFDVSDLANPRRTSQVTLPDGFTDAEYDYKAFLYWQPTGLVTLPVSVWAWDPQSGNPTEDAFTGMLGFAVTGDQVAEKGRISHPDIKPDCGDVPAELSKDPTFRPEQFCPPYKPQVVRSMVIGSHLYTFSESGMGVNDLGSLAQANFLAWS